MVNKIIVLFLISSVNVFAFTVNEKGNRYEEIGTRIFFDSDRNFLPLILKAKKAITVLSQARLNNWALSKGISVSKDSNKSGSLKNKFVALVNAPGLYFELHTPLKQDLNYARRSLRLVLDMGILQPAVKSEFLSSSFRKFNSFAEVRVMIDGLKVYTIDFNRSKKTKSPIVIHMPYVRNPEGLVKVNLEMANNKNNFFILYDAFIKYK